MMSLSFLYFRTKTGTWSTSGLMRICVQYKYHFLVMMCYHLSHNDWRGILLPPYKFVWGERYPLGLERTILYNYSEAIA